MPDNIEQPGFESDDGFIPIPREDIDSMRVSAPPDNDAMRVNPSKNDPWLRGSKPIDWSIPKVPQAFPPLTPEMKRAEREENERLSQKHAVEQLTLAVRRTAKRLLEESEANAAAAAAGEGVTPHVVMKATALSMGIDPDLFDKAFNSEPEIIPPIQSTLIPPSLEAVNKINTTLEKVLTKMQEQNNTSQEAAETNQATGVQDNPLFSKKSFDTVTGIVNKLAEENGVAVAGTEASESSAIEQAQAEAIEDMLGEAGSPDFIDANQAAHRASLTGLGSEEKSPAATAAKFSLADGEVSNAGDVDLPSHWTPGDSHADVTSQAQAPGKTLPNGQAVPSYLVVDLPDLGGFYVNGKIYTAGMKTVRDATSSEQSDCEAVVAEQLSRVNAGQSDHHYVDGLDGSSSSHWPDRPDVGDGYKPDPSSFGHGGTSVSVPAVKSINGVDVIPLKDVVTPDGIKPFADGKIVGVFDQQNDEKTLQERLGEPHAYITSNLEKNNVAEPGAWAAGLNMAIYDAGSLENKIFMVNQHLRLRFSEYSEVSMATRMKHRSEIVEIKPDDWYRVIAALVLPAMIAMEPKKTTA